MNTKRFFIHLAAASCLVVTCALPWNAEAQDELDKVADDFKKLANFGIVDGTASQVEMLPFTANLGARFRIPYAEFIGLGVHGSYRNGITPEWDARAALTLSPCGWFSITGNYGYGTFGPVCGAALSLRKNSTKEACSFWQP